MKKPKKIGKSLRDEEMKEMFTRMSNAIPLTQLMTRNMQEQLDAYYDSLFIKVLKIEEKDKESI